APIVVAVGIQWANKLHTPPVKPDASTGPPKETAAVPKESAPKAPEFGLTHLVTPNLSDHFYQYAFSEEQRKNVRSDTIDPAIFRYEANPERISVTGSKRAALLTTKAEYEDYVLYVWYRLGEKAWQNEKAPPQGYPREATVGVHITGPDGAVGSMWPQSI